MPTYDYRCDKCRKRFQIIQSITDHETKRARCPKCHSVRVTQQIGTFFAKTSRKS